MGVDDYNLIITSEAKLKKYGEHKDKKYLCYFENLPSNLIYYSFVTRYEMECFLYKNGIEKFDYKSSNGKIITKVWEYIPEKLEEWKSYEFMTAKEKKQGYPEKYTWHDFECGHYIKEK